MTLTPGNHIDDDDLVLFALQLLPEDRMRPAKQHVDNCDLCRDEIARLQGDLVAYSMTSDILAPPAAARERLMHQVAKEPRPVTLPEPLIGLQDRSGRAPDRGQDRGQDRISDRIQDRISERESNRAPDRGQDRESDRVQDWMSGRLQDRTPDRAQDRDQDREHDREWDRAHEQASDRDQERGSDRIQDRMPDRLQGRVDRAQERASDRIQDRAADRAQERGADRIQDRMSDRLQGRADRAPDRIQERAADRIQDRAPDRGHDRTSDRSPGEPTFPTRQSRTLQTERRHEEPEEPEERRPRSPRAPWVLAWTGWAVAAGCSFVAGLQLHQRQQVQNTIAAQQARMDETTRQAIHAQDALATLTAANAIQMPLHTTEVKAVLPAKPGTPAVAAPPSPEALVAYLAEKGALVFVATHMQPTPSGKTYELWLLPANGKSPIPAGTFKPDAQGSANVVMPPLPKGVQAKGFGVTMENDGGADTPTLPILLAGT